MRNTPNQGLAGKARRSRHRSRASRLHQQYLIEEYLGGSERLLDSGRARPIRIGHRPEFLPSAELGPDDSAAGQLDLPLTTPEVIDGDAVITVPKEKSATLAALEAATIAMQPSPALPVRQASTIADTGSVADEFSLRGLLVGCGMGSAAAAMVLIVIRTFLIA